jgi:uncharacterized membrane protein (DUF106 family)
MKCPNCGPLLKPDMKKDYTRPLFAILQVLLIVFFWMGFRIYGENKSLQSSIQRLEKKIEHYEFIILKYEKAIETIGTASPQKKKGPLALNFLSEYTMSRIPWR